MAIGDDAAAAGMDLVPGTLPANQIDTEINKTRDYIAQKDAATRPVAKGGTGATTAANARTNLDVYAKGETYPKTVLDSQFADINTAFANDAAAIAGKADASALAGKFDKSGGTVSGDVGVSGNVFIPGASAGGSGVIAYVQNSDSRITRGVSARRFKKNIRTLDPLALGDLAQPLVEYQMKVAYDRSGDWFIGHIADGMIGTPAERFVIFNAEGEVESIDFIPYLLAMNAQLHARLATLERPVDGEA